MQKSFKGPLVLPPNLFLFLRREVVLDVECLPYLLRCFALDHIRHCLARSSATATASRTVISSSETFSIRVEESIDKALNLNFSEFGSTTCFFCRKKHRQSVKWVEITNEQSINGPRMGGIEGEFKPICFGSREVRELHLSCCCFLRQCSGGDQHLNPFPWWWRDESTLDAGRIEEELFDCSVRVSEALTNTKIGLLCKK
ncbi:hypothetical protein CRG98_025839 [Punica granatum]|uniref:Uncharacterized protein n=1 Tax=Punica granatum TaxID=22663 RepID=A0A2I0JBY2_PUNGR|nr:hypothetical protein CRG98_025839 [Punica granatum]